MEIEKLKCPICKNAYDSSLHIPKILINCGHTICSFCISLKIHENEEHKTQNISMMLSKGFEEIKQEEHDDNNKPLSLKLDEEEEDSMLFLIYKEITYFDILISE